MSTASSANSAECVKVCVRVRPLLGYETTVKSAKIVQYPGPNSVCLISGASQPQTFTFDYVFDDYSRQIEVYDNVVSPLVKSFMEGYNTTLLAYGQTGSGKTHTMGTTFSSGASEEETGIIPRVIASIYQHIKEREQTHVHVLKVSFLEIHNEDINDLLYNLDGSKGGVQKPIPTIRDGPNNSVIVANTEEMEVRNADEMIDLLMKGSLNRVVAATEMNARSSRSHAIFSVILSQKKIKSAATSPTGTAPANAPAGSNPEEWSEPEDNFVSSRFSFVDLAGSERLKRTKAEGERMKEGININQGLLALGNVISALADDKRRAGHIPYRDSKITRILQDSLGGNSRTVMIACISPADVNSEESLNTLKYANRAKQIKNKAVINRDPTSAKIDSMRQKIFQLEAALAQFQAGNPVAAAALMGSSAVAPPAASLSSVLEIPADSMLVTRDEYQNLRDQCSANESEVKRLQQKMKDLKDEIHSANERVIQAETVRDTYKLKLERINPGAVNAIEAALKAREDSEDGQSSALSDRPVGGVEDREVDLLEENRRSINKLRRKVAKQKKALQTAKRLLEKFAGSTAPIQAATAEEAAAALESPRGKKPKLSIEPEAKDGDVEHSDDAEGFDTDSESGSEADSAGDSSELDSSADEDAESLKVLADLKAREFELQMKKLNAEQYHLTEDIQSKQSAMASLKHQSEEILRVRKEFEQKIESMEKEMAALTAEREAALKDLESKAKAADYQERVAKIKADYEQKIRTLSDQLNVTRDKLKQNDKLKRQIKEDEAKIKKLEQEIVKAKQQKVLLAKQIESNTNRYKDWVEKKENKMQSLEKEAHKAQLLIKKMQVDFEKQASILKRRNEEKAMLEKQIARAAELRAKAKKLQPEKKVQDNKVDERRVQRAIRKRKTPLKPRGAIAMASPGNGNLSDSAAPATGADPANERQIVSSIEEYIGNVFQRSLAEKKLLELKNKREALAAERNSVEEKMLEPSAAEDPNVWKSLETQLFNIDAFAANLQSQIERQEDLVRSFAPATGGESIRSPDRRRSSIGGDESASGSAVDYRAFRAIKIPTLEASKKALLYLMNAAVQYSSVNFELEEQLNLMKQTLEEEKRAKEEAEKRRIVVDKQRKRQAILSSYRMSEINVHYSLAPEGEDQPSESGSAAASPVKLIRAQSHAGLTHSPSSPRSHSNSVSGASGATALQTNNYLDESDESRAKRHAPPANIFDRLTDSSTFTGMYKNIAENKPKIKLDREREKKSTKPPHMLAKSSSASILPGTGAALVGPIFSSPSIAPLGDPGAADHSQVSKNVFSRLTDPKLFTGQAKQVFASRTNNPKHHTNPGPLIFPQHASASSSPANASTPSGSGGSVSHPTTARGRRERRNSDTAALNDAQAEDVDAEYAAAEAAHQAQKGKGFRGSAEFITRGRTQSASFIDPLAMTADASLMSAVPASPPSASFRTGHLRSNSLSPDFMSADEHSTSIDEGLRRPDDDEAVDAITFLPLDPSSGVKSHLTSHSHSYHHDDKENSQEFKQNAVIPEDSLLKDGVDETGRSHSDSIGGGSRSRPDSGKTRPSKKVAKPPKSQQSIRMRSTAGLDPSTFSR